MDQMAYPGRAVIEDYTISGSAVYSWRCLRVLYLFFIGALGTSLTPAAQADVYYVLTDHLGAPKVITNSAKATVWQATYHPFGEVDVEMALIENNVRLPGQYFDRETGLHYNYFRDYDPNVGRYLQSDPIGLEGGLNTYAYVSGNPISLVDPLGLAELVINGKNYGFVNGNQLANIISSQASSSIGNMSLFNHGTSFSLELADGHMLYNSSMLGQVVIVDESGNTLANLAGILKDKLSDNASLELKGCFTASGKNSISQNLSGLLGANVSGFTTYAVQFYFRPTGHGVLVGVGQTYSNGSSADVFPWATSGNAQ